jgi:enoyl-CoA hydratase/carnithine racemase
MRADTLTTPMGFQTLRLETAGHIARMTLARPETGNRVDALLVRELDEACAAIGDDADARVALVAAEGEAFSLGWDAAELSPEGFDAAALRERWERSPPFTCFEQMAQPVVCAINGDATSAGLELALACDVRIAGEGARFALPETGEGLLPLAGGVSRLARAAGQAEALRLLLLGETIDAQEALRIGLVSAVVPGSELLTKATALAERIASRGPLAVRYAKEAVRRGLEQPLDQALRYETDLTVILQTTEDRAEGVRAFVEKREPEFRGR